MDNRHSCWLPRYLYCVLPGSTETVQVGQLRRRSRCFCRSEAPELDLAPESLAGTVLARRLGLNQPGNNSFCGRVEVGKKFLHMLRPYQSAIPYHLVANRERP